MRQIFQKVPLSSFHILVLFSLKHPSFEEFLAKNHQIIKKTLLSTAKYENLVKNMFNINFLKFLDDLAAQIVLFKNFESENNTML